MIPKLLKYFAFQSWSINYLIKNIMMILSKTEGMIVRSSQFLQSNLFPQRMYEDKQLSFIATAHKFSKSCHHSSLYPRKKSAQSRTINIEFKGGGRRMLPQEVQMRRRLLSSSEKFYNQKKAVMFNFIRQKNQACKDMMGGKYFLKVGSRQIKPELKSEESAHAKSNLLLNKRLRKERRIRKKSESLIEKQSSVLIFQPKPIIKAEQFFTTLPPSFRIMTQDSKVEALMKQKTEPVIPERVRKVVCQRAASECQEFMPLMKRKQRKEPFVFGMSGKAFFNPQKNEDKLMAYHDFLWKVNYANGLFVKASQNPGYNAFVGTGNNCSLIRSIIQRRHWWTLLDRMEDCHFVWTQLKANNIQKAPHQKPSQTIISKLFSFDFQEADDKEYNLSVNHHRKIFNRTDLSNWVEHTSKNTKYEQSINERTYKHRVNFYRSRRISVIQQSNSILVHNHLSSNFYIGNKKALFYFMRSYYQQTGQDLSTALPLTFHITNGISDSSYKAFLKKYQQIQIRKRRGQPLRNVWIIKPGENSNRGRGISVCFSLDEIKNRVNGRQRGSDGNLRTFIIQKYMEGALLYRGRKFDIRHYMLLTCFNGIFRAYWFPEGYLRTSSQKYTLQPRSSPLVHLTNDAVQKDDEDYGRYEKGNKVSYQSFAEYLSKTKNVDENVFQSTILPRMRQLALDAVRATFRNLDSKRMQHNFQLLGMDFMIDGDMKPYLIEINTNPCLELSSPLLATLIPALLEETFKLCIDPLFPPPKEWPPTRRPYFSDNPLSDLRYELLFDEAVDGAGVREGQMERQMGRVEEDADTYEDDGDFCDD